MHVPYRWLRASFLLASLVLLLVSSITPAGDQRDPRGVIIEELRNPAPAFLVRVAVDRPNRTYKGGDEMKVEVRSGAEGYLYLFYVTAEQKTLLLFPNFVQKVNRVSAGKPVQVPAVAAKFRLRIGPPFGKEVLLAVVTRSPLAVKGLEVENLVKKDMTEIDFAKVKEAYAALVKGSPGEWARDSIELTTVDPKAPAPVVSKERRIALCVGISKHKFAPELDTPVCVNAARAMKAMLKESCGLDEEPILVTDANATRSNLEKAISRDLPAKTKPGDTVIIFWSGHGEPIRTRDGKVADHFLVLHETTMLKLPAKATEEEVNKAVEAFLRGVLPSAVLGDWLRRLDGRRIVLLVEACFSGAIHAKTVHLSPPSRSIESDDDPFLGGLVRRSRVINQRDLALLASSSAGQPSAIRFEQDYGVYTYHLIEALRNGNDPLTLAQTHDRVRRSVTEFIPQWRKRRQEGLEKNIKLIDLQILVEKDEQKRQRLSQLREDLRQQVEDNKVFSQTPVMVDDITPPFHLRPVKGR